MDTADFPNVALMRDIFIANPKGGCGKTTIATQLASYYAARNHRVALLDHDAQQSSLDWLKSRPAACPAIVPIAAYRAVDIPENVDIAIHDMPAGCGVDGLQEVWRQDARLIIPLMASPTDIKAAVRFLMSLNRDGDFLCSGKIALVANRVRKNTRYFRVLEAFLEEVNVPMITCLRDTQNYIRAMDRGLSLFDLPERRIALDHEHWQPLLAWLAE